MKNQIVIAIILFIVLSIGILFDNSPKMTERKNVSFSPQTINSSKNVTSGTKVKDTENGMKSSNSRISGSDNFKLSDNKNLISNNSSIKYCTNQNLTSLSSSNLEDKNNFDDEKPKKNDVPFVFIENVNWDKWRSDFVNTILLDTSNLEHFMSYPNGSWLYYSFWVHSDGTITDISVRSIHFADDAKLEVYNLIKSYEHKQVTVFPENTRREKVKVKAIIILDMETEGVNPGMFNDIESYQHY